MPEEVRQDKEGKWSQKNHKSQDDRQSHIQITFAVQAHAVVEVFADANNILLR